MNASLLKNQQIKEGLLKEAGHTHLTSKATAKPTHSAWVSTACLSCLHKEPEPRKCCEFLTYLTAIMGKPSLFWTMASAPWGALLSPGWGFLKGNRGEHGIFKLASVPFKHWYTHTSICYLKGQIGVFFILEHELSVNVFSLSDVELRFSLIPLPIRV